MAKNSVPIWSWTATKLITESPVCWRSTEEVRHMARRDEVRILGGTPGEPLVAQFCRPHKEARRPSPRGNGGGLRVPNSSITAVESAAAALCGDVRKTNAELRATEKIAAWPTIFDKKNRPAGVTREEINLGDQL